MFWAAFQLSPASETVEGLARSYMGIRVWSAPAAIAIFGLTGWLIAAERTGAVLAIQVGMNGLNILLDLLFVLGFDWGVQGVAIATFIAEWSGFFLALWLCRDGLKGDAWRNWAQIFDRMRIFNMVRVNTDILIRSLLLQVGFVSFLLIGSDFGDVTLAANQILLQFLYITSYAMDGFTFSAEALVGQAMGARARGRLRQSVLMTSAWSLVTVVALAAVFALIGPWLIELMATSPKVRTEALVYLPWMIAAPLLGGPSWIFDGIFIGATRSQDMRNMMIVSFAIYCLAILLLVDPFANHGLWAAMMIFFVARGLTLGVRYPALERAAA
jgi:MATE family multidrug resistance protein